MNVDVILRDSEGRAFSTSAGFHFHHDLDAIDILSVSLGKTTGSILVQGLRPGEAILRVYTNLLDVPLDDYMKVGYSCVCCLVPLTFCTSSVSCWSWYYAFRTCCSQGCECPFRIGSQTQRTGRTRAWWALGFQRCQDYQVSIREQEGCECHSLCVLIYNVKHSSSVRYSFSNRYWPYQCVLRKPGRSDVHWGT